MRCFLGRVTCNACTYGQVHAEAPTSRKQGCTAVEGALLVRIRFGGILYCASNMEPPKPDSND